MTGAMSGAIAAATTHGASGGASVDLSLCGSPAAAPQQGCPHQSTVALDALSDHQKTCRSPQRGQPQPAVRPPPAVQSRLVELRAGGNDMLQLLRLQNSDPPSLKPDPSTFLPGPQPLVRAFAGSTHDLADLALRNRDLAAPVRVLGLLG